MGHNIAILAPGSRGDVQPCLALGQGLTRHGHTVKVMASPRYQHLITDAGLDFHALTHDPAQIVASPQGQELLAAGQNPAAFLRRLHQVIEPLLAGMLAEAQAGAESADLVLAPSFGFLGLHLSHYLQVPHAIVHFQPSQPTSAFPHPLAPAARLLGRLGNRRSFDAVDLATWAISRRTVNAWRRHGLGLAPLRLPDPIRQARHAPVLCAFSPTIVPRPTDWGPNVHLTGYWFHDPPAWTPPPTLLDFLDAGPPPVYIGFGSMRTRDPEATDHAVRAALQRNHLRAVLTGDPATSDDDTYVTHDIPHHWLFPKMRAVVHHGGAGTTAAALRAATPQLICPFFGDQPYWANRIHHLGASPPPLPAHHITTETLTNRLHTLTTQTTHTHTARQLAQALTTENGVTHTIHTLTTLLPPN